MRRDKPSLKAIQNWMQATIMHPGDVTHGAVCKDAAQHVDLGRATLEKLIEPGPQLSAAERLQIYGNMYFWRLVDILGEEYPTVRHVLGQEEFSRIAFEYVELHPSTSYSLNPYSRKFAQFLKKEATALKNRALVADIARVERTMEEVFDEKAAKPVTVKKLQSIPMDRWAGARFVVIPALRLLELSYPVDHVIAAVRKQQQVDLPKRGKERMVIYRKHEVVWRQTLGDVDFTLLSSLHAGKTLVEGFEACAARPGFDAERFTSTLQGTFKNWAAAGMFAEIQVEGK